MPTMGATWTQLLPPSPPFTEEQIPSLNGKVFIVTGGNAGVGLELVKMLYSKGGCTIYIASRTASRIEAAIEDIRSSLPAPTATPSTQLKSLVVDFSDLRTISKAVSAFLAQETRLDVLWNNAGIAQAPFGSVTAQGHEAHMGVNCLAPYLFTKLLTPLLIQTARKAPDNSVRVIFTSSQIIDGNGPPGGVNLAELAPGKHVKNKDYTYSVSKAANWFLAVELDKRVRKDGVVAITQNPGNLVTKAWEPVPKLKKLLLSPFLYPPKMGAFTELWCGLSPEITSDDGGKYAIPWGGRWHPNPRPDILPSFRPTEEGGTGLAAKVWDYCDEHTAMYTS